MSDIMADERNATDESQEQAESSPDVVDEAPVMSERPVSGLDQEEFETPSSRYLGLFGTVGALVGLAVGIQQGNSAFGMAVGLAIGVGLGLLLNLYTGQ